MEKRIIIATILSSLVLIVWWIFIFPPHTPPQINRSIIENKQKVVSVSDDKEKTEKQTKIEYIFESNIWKVIFDPYGSKIKHWYIKETKSKDYSLPDLVFDPEGENLSTFNTVEFQFLKSFKDENFQYVIFCLKNNNFEIYKKYKLSLKNHFHELIIEVNNKSKNVLPFDILWGPGLGSDEKIKENEKKILRPYSIEKIEDKSNSYRLKKLKSGEYEFKNFFSVGFDNTYFVVNFINSNNSIDKVFLQKNEKTNIQQISLNTEILPNSKKTINILFFLGPKIYTELKKINNGLEKTVDFGLFGDLTKLFLFILNYLYKLVHNYGFAIIILTLIIQIITLPLIIKSMSATKAMKKIQPKITEIQQKYKNDPKRMQTEIMYLYKSQKVNPFGGCLPMLLQIPIFWSLFTGLKGAYELRNAKFILWIKDLSHQDPVLPILMGISMFIQQKMSTVASDQSQKMLLYFMPIMFVIIFWNFPSGLVLYWLTSNILSIIIQYFVLKKQN